MFRVLKRNDFEIFLCSVIFSTENTDNYYSVILLIQEQTVCLKVGKLFATCAS